MSRDDPKPPRRSTDGSAPAPWLAAWQGEFSAMLRTPLSRQGGQLATPAHALSPALRQGATAGPLADAAARLGVYHRQYWFRLLQALQQDFPLTTALLGPWHLNGIALAFLQAHAPRTRDLGTAADGFAAFMAGEAAGQETMRFEAPKDTALDPLQLPALALTQAAAIDEAYRTVLRAPPQAKLRRETLDMGRLATGRLVRSAATALLAEDRPLVQLRRQGLAGDAEHAGHRETGRPRSLPPRYADGTHHWLVARHPGGIRLSSLQPLQARLYSWLSHKPVTEALALFEQEAHRGGVADGELSERVRRWLAASVEEGLWAELVDGPEAWNRP